MLFARKGERSPRVVALQILLNRHKPGGRVLKVDGSYGDKTAGAVKAYHAEFMKSSAPGETAGPVLWQHLLGRHALQVVEAVDVSDPDVADLMLDAIGDWTNPIALGPLSNGLGQVMTEIKARAKNKPSVACLRFHGHGAPGLAAVSFGKRSLFPGVSAFEQLSVLTVETIKAVRPHLAEIVGAFPDFGFVELHACKVARGPQGAALLRDLAAIWRVPVTAGTASQSAEGKNNYILTGTLVTMFPRNVDLRTWASTRAEAGVEPT